jgi:orotate phosphoribosyltransferase
MEEFSQPFSSGERMSKSEHPIDVLAEKQCIMQGHFVLKSRKHSSVYINKIRMYPDPVLLSTLCIDLATKFKEKPVDIVVGPALGGIALALCTAKSLSVWRNSVVPWAFAEKEGDGFTFRDPYPEYLRNKRVLVVDDIITTGGSIQRTVDAVKEAGGSPLGVAAICNRGRVTAETLGVPLLHSLIEMALEDTWEEQDCPLCNANQPVSTVVGHGKEFLARKAKEKP